MSSPVPKNRVPSTMPPPWIDSTAGAREDAGRSGRTIVISTAGAPAGPGIVRSSQTTARPATCSSIGGMMVAKCARLARIVSARSGMISTRSTKAVSPATSSAS